MVMEVGEMVDAALAGFDPGANASPFSSAGLPPAIGSASSRLAKTCAPICRASTRRSDTALVAYRGLLRSTK